MSVPIPRTEYTPAGIFAGTVNVVWNAPLTLNGITILAPNFFADIKVNINANILTIAVIEYPVVQTIEFNGIKKKLSIF